MEGSEPTLGCRNGPYSAVWRGGSDGEGWFDWSNGDVYTTDPDEAAVEKMLGIAGRLGAGVRGEDGETYPRNLSPEV